MTLNILISQYKETEQDIKPMLDSIAIQQGIDLNDIKVIIANDGSDVIISDEFLESYSYEIDYYLVDHRGMSGIRNFLLDRATADYIMFCDADDMFYNVTALYTILSIIKQGEFDCLFPNFIVENKNNKGKFTYHQFFECQVHGKVLRRQYLLDKNIRWKDDLLTHDSRYFFGLCEACTTPDRIKRIVQPYYLWKYNEKSTTHSVDNHFLDKYDYFAYSAAALVDELIKRGNLNAAVAAATSFIYLTYFMYNSEPWKRKDKQEVVQKAIKDFKLFYDKYSSLMELNSEAELMKIIQQTREDVSKREKDIFLETITFDEWISQIQQIGDAN